MVEKVHIDPPLAYGVAQCTVRTMRTRSHPRSGTHHGMQNPRVLLGACMLKGQRQSWTQHDRTRNVDDRMCSPCSPCSAISMRDFPAPFAEPRPNGRLAVLLPPSRSPLSVASDGKSAGGRVASRAHGHHKQGGSVMRAKSGLRQPWRRWSACGYTSARSPLAAGGAPALRS